ncbi:hypothetical protein DV453_000825 [Geotrichum candidum]|nr:hypothetical protein DV453_000825 [Geotrichum candidum]
MSKVSKPKITEMKRPQEYTKITFKPDLKLFHMEKIDDDLISLLSRRVYDVAGCLRDVKVMLNKERINIRSFKSYVEMFLNALAKNDDEADPTKKPVIVHEIVNDRWEIAFAVSDGSFNQVSFVNSIATTSGGSHVTYIADQIVTKISEIVKKGKVPIRPSQIKNNMFLFVNCLIENPAFTSQTKEQLTTRPSAFGSKCVLTPEFLKKVMKTPILDKVKNIATQNADNEQKKTDGGKNRRIKGVTKLEDANKAGTRDGHKCTLILTEGDSAASLAVAGLAVTIINLAQDFVGSNNLYILMPNGSFGSRAVGGKDSAAPRYIFTELNTLTKKIFNPADGPLLNYLADDEATVEPEWYLPILPMILVNGAEGIGTGWSTNIPGFNPIDIINNIKRLLNGEEMDEMMPWFRGWTGVIDKLPDNKYRARGLISQVDDTTLEITELPPKMWTQNMRDFLLSSLKDRRGAQSEKAGWIDDFTEEHGTGIRFVIKLSREEMAKTMKEGPYNRFRLVSTINLSNMMAFDSQNRIKKYDSPLQILSEFYYLRLEYYQKRKDFVSNLLRNQLTKLSEQAKFVKLIIEKKLSIANRKKVDIIAELKRLDFPAFDKNNVPTKQTSIEEAAVEIDEEELPEDVEDPRKHFPTFDYLLGMSILSLTKERYERLLRERGVKEEELNILLKKTPKDLWIEDLDDFLDAWETFETEDTERRESVVASRKKGGKKRARKAASDDEFDGDFTTTKKKKKAAAPKKISEIKREPLPFEPPIVKTNSRATAIKKEKTASASASASAEPEETKKTQAAKPKGKRKAIDNEEENDVEIKEEGFSFGKTASIFGTPFKRTKKKDEYDLEPEALFSDLTGGSTSNGTKPTNGSDKKSASSSAAASASAEPEPVKSRFALSISSDDDDDDGIFSNLKKQTAEKKKTTAATMLSAKSKTVPAAETEKDKDAKPKLLQRKLNFQPATKATSPAAAAKPVTAAKPKKKPAAKSNSVLSDDENEDSAAEDEPLVAAPTPKRASRRAAASKPKYVVDFSDEDDGEEEDEEPSIMISSDSE